MNLSQLTDAVAKQAAFRRRVRLQPVGGVGDRVSGPTFPGERNNDPPRHVFEARRVNGETVETALIDSVQSSANRAEEGPRDLARAGRIPLPYVTVDFSGTAVADIGEITSLDAPHRIFDAILRDSLLGDEPFMKSEVGKRLQLANLGNATAILEVSPSALLFGAWNSTGEGGGLGAKFPRVFVSEIFGVNVPVEKKKGSDELVSTSRRTSSRIDPLGILRDVSAYKRDTRSGVEWEATGELKGFKRVRASEVNHGNIKPSVVSLSFTMDYAEHVTVISLAGIRRLRFGSNERDLAARAMIAALGLVAHYAQIERGYALRSRCDLVPEGSSSLELVNADGTTEVLSLTIDDVIALYSEAYEAAKKVGFSFVVEPLRLVPQDKLIAIVAESREMALAGKGGEGEEKADASSGD